MAQYGFAPRGGCEGILTSHEEMYALACKLNAKYADEFIPVPNVSPEEQKQRFTDCSHSNVSYWENNNGNHGWACTHCGSVVQWG